ncbi:MAG: hypothetical protein L6Q97_09740, partial [Thermoanaerobaculia bacterium]|nr:hypothetical protein [Thermoanaerobaculia bacterium]
LLGLYTFGLFTKLHLHPWSLAIRGTNWTIPGVLLVCILAPLITWGIEVACKQWFDVGFLTILLNGIITFAGLWIMSYRDDQA